LGEGVVAQLCSVLDKQPAIHTWPYGLRVGDGGFYGIVKYYFGQNQLRRSILHDPEEETKFRYIFKKLVTKPINLAIETGTYKGTGTAMLARYATNVITIDVKNYIEKYAFWLELGLYDKIESYIVEDEEDKADFLGRVNFDFAFIDGDHSEAGVRADFECVKKCGRVLFHDYYEQGTSCDQGAAGKQGIVQVVNELPSDEVTIYRPFAYWERGNERDIDEGVAARV
jgi:predicted O-methyltransferase YrrM